MDPELSSNPSPERARAQDAARQRQSPRPAANSASDRRANAYTPKPDFASPPPHSPPKPARNPWAGAVGVAALLLVLGGGLALKHFTAAPVSPRDNTLTLETADIDQAATADARAMLARGEIPPVLAHASEETRRAVADGRQSLYTKQLMPPETPADVAVHVAITEAGAVLAEDELTSAHPRTTTFPSGPGMPVHFHFLVDSAGPTGSVTCWANSSSGATVYTPPMPKSGTGDLEAVAR